MEEKNPTKIIRRSIFTFLQNYHHFSAVAAVLLLPFSAAVLLSQAFFFISQSPNSLISTLHTRLNSLFQAAGLSFPPHLDFFNILSLKLSQTMASSIFTLPFTLTFLLLAKASVIQALIQNPRNSVFFLFFPLFKTYLFNSLLLISANATAFALFFLSSNFFLGFQISSPNYLIVFVSASSAVIYSIILANSLVICNLALIISAAEKSGGLVAILKACVLIRGRASTALTLSLPANLGFAGIEALFHYKIVKSFYAHDRQMSSMAMETMLIAYLYSIVVVLDTIVNFLFYKICKDEYLPINRENFEDRHSHKIEIL